MARFAAMGEKEYADKKLLLNVFRGVTKTHDMLGPCLLSNMNNCEGNKYVKIRSCSTLPFVLFLKFVVWDTEKKWEERGNDKLRKLFCHLRNLL